jgi:hypothetical protein
MRIYGGICAGHVQLTGPSQLSQIVTSLQQVSALILHGRRLEGAEAYRNCTERTHPTGAQPCQSLLPSCVLPRKRHARTIRILSSRRFVYQRGSLMQNRNAPAKSPPSLVKHAIESSNASASSCLSSLIRGIWVIPWSTSPPKSPSLLVMDFSNAICLYTSSISYCVPTWMHNKVYLVVLKYATCDLVL